MKTFMSVPDCCGHKLVRDLTPFPDKSWPEICAPQNSMNSRFSGMQTKPKNTTKRHRGRGQSLLLHFAAQNERSTAAIVSINLCSSGAVHF